MRVTEKKLTILSDHRSVNTSPTFLQIPHFKIRQFHFATLLTTQVNASLYVEEKCTKKVIATPSTLITAVLGREFQTQVSLNCWIDEIRKVNCSLQ